MIPYFFLDEDKEIHGIWVFWHFFVKQVAENIVLRSPEIQGRAVSAMSCSSSKKASKCSERGYCISVDK